MIDTLGSPDNPRTKKRLKIFTKEMGTPDFRITGASIAMLGLDHVFSDAWDAGRTDLVSSVFTDGMYNLRKIRGRDVWSNHAWAMAVDLNFGPGEELGDGLVQFGLMELYPFFHKRGWYWGGGYHGREDGMHWEPSVSLIETWINSGLL